MSSKICMSCKSLCDVQNMNDPTIKLDVNGFYECHQRCFNCFGCRRQLSVKNFILCDERQNIYCQTCYINLYMTFCMHCAKELNGNYTNINANRYHNTCAFEVQRILRESRYGDLEDSRLLNQELMKLITSDYTRMDTAAKQMFNELIQFESRWPFPFEENVNYSKFQPKPNMPTFLQPRIQNPHPLFRVFRGRVEQQHHQALELHQQNGSQQQDMQIVHTQKQLTSANSEGIKLDTQPSSYTILHQQQNQSGHPVMHNQSFQQVEVTQAEAQIDQELATDEETTSGLDIATVMEIANSQEITSTQETENMQEIADKQVTENAQEATKMQEIEQVDQMKENEEEELLDIADLEDVINKLIKTDEDVASSEECTMSEQNEHVKTLHQQQKMQPEHSHNFQHERPALQSSQCLTLPTQQKFQQQSHSSTPQQSQQSYNWTMQEPQPLQKDHGLALQPSQQGCSSMQMQPPNHAFIPTQQQEFCPQSFQPNHNWTLQQQMIEKQNSFPLVGTSANHSNHSSQSSVLQRTAKDIKTPKRAADTDRNDENGHCSKKPLFGIEVHNEEFGNEIVFSQEKGIFESATLTQNKMSNPLQNKSNVTLPAKFHPPKIVKQPTKMLGRQNMTYPLPHQRQPKTESVIYQIIDGPSTFSKNVDSATENLFKLVYEESVPAEPVLASSTSKAAGLSPPTPTHAMNMMRHRAVIKYEYRMILEEAFQESQFPTRAERVRLGLLTELDQRQVQIWFQNQRSKVKKMAK